jgi:hypothetical protein
MAYVTGAFPGGIKYPARHEQSQKRWLAVLHRFDADGNHLGSESRLGGYERDGQAGAQEQAWTELESMFAALCAHGEPAFGDIRARLFSVELDSVVHGLFYELAGDEEGDEECVMLEPPDVMFHPPWDSGEYST